MNEYKPFYRRKLPHYHTPEADLFVTVRLANSIPRAVINSYRNQKAAIDAQLARLVKTIPGDDVEDLSLISLEIFIESGSDVLRTYFTWKPAGRFGSRILRSHQWF